MKNSNPDRKYYIPAPVINTGEPDEHLQYEMVEVNEEVYKAFYRPVWRERDKAKNHGGCSYAGWAKCSGDCCICRYQAINDTDSIDRLIELAKDSTDVLRDPMSQIFEEQIADAMLLGQLLEKIRELDPESRQICEMIMEGMTERETAERLGLSKSTLHDWKEKTLKQLRNFLGF